MRVEIKYFADDDTEFDSKKECEAYEELLFTQFDSVQFFDNNCKPIPQGNLVGIESDAFFIRILDVEKATRLFDWLYRRISFNYPECFYDKGDILHFNDQGNWENLTKERERISEYIRRVEGR